MTGPEHYRAAETFLRQATQMRHPENGAAMAVIAQVHATLALAAATAASIRRNGALGDAINDTLRQWSAVCMSTDGSAQPPLEDDAYWKAGAGG